MERFIPILIIIIYVLMRIKPKSSSRQASKKTTEKQLEKKNILPNRKVLHDETSHTHDRLSEHLIVSETPDEHYRHQIEAFFKAGLIDRKEAKTLWENYEKSKQIR